MFILRVRQVQVNQIQVRHHRYQAQVRQTVVQARALIHQAQAHPVLIPAQVQVARLRQTLAHHHPALVHSRCLALQSRVRVQVVQVSQIQVQAVRSL